MLAGYFLLYGRVKVFTGLFPARYISQGKLERDFANDFRRELLPVDELVTDWLAASGFLLVNGLLLLTCSVLSFFSMEKRGYLALVLFRGLQGRDA